MSLIPLLGLAASTPVPPSGGWPPASRAPPPEDPLLPLLLPVPPELEPELEPDPEALVLLPEVPPELLDDPPLVPFPMRPDPPPSPSLLVQRSVELAVEHAASAAPAVRNTETRQRTRSRRLLIPSRLAYEVPKMSAHGS